MKSTRATTESQKKVEDVNLRILYMWGPGRKWGTTKEEGEHSRIILIPQSVKTKQ